MKTNNHVDPQVQKEIYDFMDKEGIRVDQNLAPQFLIKILQECQSGLKGKPSSLKMFNTFTTRKVNYSNNQPLKLIIDAGGTNFRVVVMRIQELHKEVIYYRKNPMPGSQGKITKKDFFEKIVDYLSPVIDNQDFKKYDANFKEFSTLQFCFSYPTCMDESGEGFVKSLSKEIWIDNITDQPIKENLLTALHERGYTQFKNVVILNDTTATLLAGCYEKTVTRKIDNYNGFLGIVWGTGFNIAYEENSFFNKPYIVNSEAGCFEHFPMSNVDKEIDTTSQMPGKGLTEKKISGYYFGPMCKHLLGQFIKNSPSQKNLFSSAFQEIILDPKVKLKSEHISQFLLEKNTSNKLDFFFKRNNKNLSQIISWSDQSYLQLFIDRLGHRSAYLTALMSTGLILQSLGIDSTPFTALPKKKKFCLILDGSMIRKMPGLKETLSEYLSFLLKPYNIFFETLEIDKAPIIGTAIATFDFTQ